MPRWSILLLGSVMAVAMYACGGAPAPATTSAGGVCSVVNAGPPVVCSEGCRWDGKECQEKRGIIMDDAVDSGTPPAK